MNWQEFSSRLKPGQEIWIMAHEKPDGDAWGSGFGFGIVMESLGYKPRFIRPSANISTSFSWLPGQHLIHCVPGKSLQPPADALVVVLDCGDIERCEHNLGPVEILLNVDHHVSNPGYGELNWLDTRAGATAQVLCKIFCPLQATTLSDHGTDNLSGCEAADRVDRVDSSKLNHHQFFSIF